MPVFYKWMTNRDVMDVEKVHQRFNDPIRQLVM